MDNKVYTATVDQANKHSIEPRAALAVFDVESAGVAFWNVDGKMLPPIRFEGHYFYARLNAEQRVLAVNQGLASPKAGAIKNPTSYSGRYAMLERAKAISATAALESTSWGLGQVMGANWESLGYPTVEALVDATKTIDGQVDMVFRYIEVNGLSDEINSHDWEGFKNGYNGKQANGYDKKMAMAYAKFGDEPVSPKNDETIQLQKMLNSVGDYGLETDGDFGTATKAALRDFQLKNGLVVDGLYGPISKQTLEKAYLAKSNKATTNIGVSGMGLGTVGSAMSEAAKSIQGFAGTSQIIQYVFVGMLVIGAIFTTIGIIKSLRAK